MRACRDKASITLSLKDFRGRQDGDGYIREGRNVRAYRPRYPVRPGPSMAVHGALMHIMGGMCTCRGSQLFDTAAGRFAVYVPPLSPARIAHRPLAKSFLSISRFCSSYKFPIPLLLSRTVGTKTHWRNERQSRKNKNRGKGKQQRGCTHKMLLNI